MKKILTILVVAGCIFSGFTFSPANTAEIGVDNTLNYFKSNIQPFVASAKELRKAISLIEKNDTISILKARRQLAACRDAYKRIEFFTEYFFGSQVVRINLPPVHEVEEPSLEYQWPVGFQVMEDLLFEEEVWQHKKQLLNNAEVIVLSAEGFLALLYDKQFFDEGILKSLYLELIRISALNITGFDAPLLKTGIHESATALLSFKENIQPYLLSDAVFKDSISLYLNRSIDVLVSTDSFNDFDRMKFLTEAMLPLQKQMILLLNKLNPKIEDGEIGVVNYKAAHLFDKFFLNVDAFDSSLPSSTKPLIELGKKLFFDTRLSGNNKRSCASCHMPGKYFTDGLKQSIAFDEQNVLRRNAPSVLYTAYQYNNFWDGRSPSLAHQVLDVTAAPNEMNADAGLILQKLATDRKYRKLFRKAFGDEEKGEHISMQHLAKAIAVYEKSLPVMTSAFDKYIGGDKSALTQRQVAGFNLFMGKAQCATCHFAPVFNGLLPPLYDITEVESLGITTNADFDNPVADADSGRYHIRQSQFFIGSFKTPTVRNAAKTAPYMHNGSLNSLTEVIQFYNKGGGNGMGLNFPNQTLSDRPLELTDKEIADLVSFIESLTDETLWLKK